MAHCVYEDKIWPYVEKDLQGEQVASIDHIRRTVARAKVYGAALNADMDVLIPGALLHDIGVVIDRKRHFVAGRERAAQILREVGYPGDKIEGVLHVIEAHSRYGGVSPGTLEAKIMRDIDAIDYVGAVGVARAAVRGLNDGSFDGKMENFPQLLNKIMAGVKDGVYFEETRRVIDEGIQFFELFLARLDKEVKERV